MHYWGDEWFKKHGNSLYAAIEETDKALRKVGIGCLTKEKYGTRREDMLKLWDGGWYTIIYGPKFISIISGLPSGNLSKVYIVSCTCLIIV